MTLFLDGREVVTLLVTPENLKDLAVGFMLSEGWLREDKPEIYSHGERVTP